VEYFAANKIPSLSGLLLDVRSPSEYEQGHIPQARSLPLFSDEERAVVGTLYKKKGKKIAIRKGLELIGPKMYSLVEQVDQMLEADEQKIHLYCWRGGMRSSSVALLLHTAGFNVSVLEGGYKAYRRWGTQLLEQDWNLRIITGHTGSGKTEVLQQLSSLGQQVLDLEGLANHRGSSFGALGKEAQPSTEHFHNLIVDHLISLSIDRPVWLEDESIRIGKCHIPENFFLKMKECKWYRLERGRQNRIEHIIQLYGDAPKEEIAEAILRLEKRLGNMRTKECLSALNAKDEQLCTDLLLDYYDKFYEKSMQKRENSNGRTLSCENEGFTDIAKTLIKIDNE
jgi:tRNA 2-selenouridine synthase